MTSTVTVVFSLGLLEFLLRTECYSPVPVSGFVFFGSCCCFFIMLVIDTVFSTSRCTRYEKILPQYESFANDNFNSIVYIFLAMPCILF